MLNRNTGDWYLTGSRHRTQPNSASSEEISALVKDLVSNIEESLSKPVCTLDVVLDCRSEVVRMAEVIIPPLIPMPKFI
jgi:hypothetical protein